MRAPSDTENGGMGRSGREIIRGLFIGLTVATIAMGIGGPMLGFSTGSSLLWMAGWFVVWLVGALFLALVKAIVL